MKSSKKRGLIITILVLSTAGLIYFTSVRARMMKLYSIADRESVFQFMSFELRHFGGDAVMDIIEFPPQLVPVYSLEHFEMFREGCGGPTVYTMMDPSADLPNHFSDNMKTLRTTYVRTYYFFNNAGTIVWEYTHARAHIVRATLNQLHTDGLIERINRGVYFLKVEELT